MSTFLTNLSKTIADTITPNRPRPYPATGGPIPQKSNKCMFDGGDHFIRDCPGVDEYVKQGKCRRNYEGKVVLYTVQGPGRVRAG
jgi:hypothetical protein